MHSTKTSLVLPAASLLLALIAQGCGPSNRSSASQTLKTDLWTLQAPFQLNPAGRDAKAGSYYRTSTLAVNAEGKPVVAWTAGDDSSLLVQIVDFEKGTASPPRKAFNAEDSWIDHPTMAVDREKKLIFLAAWQKKIKAPNTGDKHVYFARSADGGQTWSPQVILNQSNGAFAPTMATDGQGAIYVVWKDERNGLADLYFNRSRDYGATWLPQDVRLSPGTPGNGVTTFPVLIGEPGGKVFLAYSHTPEGSVGSIYFRSSSDFGATWSEIVRINDNPSVHMDFPQLAVLPDNRIGVSWIYNGDRGFSAIYFDSSADGGKTWGADRILYGSTKSATEYLRMISLPKESLLLYWVDRIGEEFPVVFKGSKDFGTRWQGENQVDGRLNVNLGQRRSVDLRLDTDGDKTLVAAWGEYVLGSTLIKASFSLDKGATWLSESIEASPEKEGESDYRFPQIVVSEDQVFLIFHRSRGNNTDIFFRGWTMTGWAGERRIRAVKSGQQP
jgi:hypothetical protein